MAIEHNVIATANIHPLPGLGPYANEAARTGASVAAADVGKAVIQSDTLAVWMLVQVTPTRWQRIGGGPPCRVQAGAGVYTTTIDDADALVEMTSASAVTPTIPPNSSVPYQIGDTILFLQGGTGLMTLAPGAGVTFLGASFVSAGQNSVLCATKIAINTWVIYGKTT